MFPWRQRFALAVTDVPVNAILTILSVRPLRIIAYTTRVQSLWLLQDSAQRVRTIKPDIKLKFIHCAARGKLNNHCNKNGLLGMKQWRAATFFVITSHSTLHSPYWLISESRELYMALLAIEWQSANIYWSEWNLLAPSYGPFSKGV